MSGFSRQFRLGAKRDFQSVFDSRQKINQKFLFGRYTRTKYAYVRLGIIVPKAIIKRAVDRNKIRRVIRESFRHHKHLLKELDIVIVIRSECLPHDMKLLREDIDNLWICLIHV